MVDKTKDLVATDGSVVRVKLTDIGDGMHALRAEAYPPKGLVTDNDGPNGRLRVDTGSTHFFKGRHYRSFKELNIASGSALVIKAVVPVNTILLDFKVDLTKGSLRCETLSGPGAIEGGTFDDPLPVFVCNSMTEVPEPAANQVTLTAGGTLTGGVLRDVFFAQVASQGQQQQSVGAGQEDIRGVAPATFYFKFIASGSDPSQGVLHVRWEERP